MTDMRAPSRRAHPLAVSVVARREFSHVSTGRITVPEDFSDRSLSAENARTPQNRAFQAGALSALRSFRTTLDCVVLLKRLHLMLVADSNAYFRG